MNTPPPIGRTASGTDDPLQLEIQGLVRALQAALEEAPEIYRKLCGLALAHRVDPEVYRVRLVRAGMAPSHASDFKTLLGSAFHCDAFLRPKGVPGCSTWARALRLARKEARWEVFGFGPALEATKSSPAMDARIERAVLAAQLAGLLHRSGQSVLAVAGGTLELTCRVGDLDSLLKEEVA